MTPPTLRLTASAAAAPTEESKPLAEVGSFTSDNPGSVNTYWLEAPDGLILIDGLRSISDAERALTELKQTGEPIVAIVLTHAHPDHVGGLGVFKEAFPDAKIHATKTTATTMAEDPHGFYALTHDQLGDDHNTMDRGCPIRLL